MSLPLAIITGGTSGIGLAIARRLLPRYQLALLYGHNHEKARQAAHSLGISPDQTLPVDLTRDQDVEEGYVRLTERFPDRPQVLINAAGIRGPGNFFVQGFQLDQAQQLMELHYFGTLRMVSRVLPGMYRERRGSIINLSSISARGGYKGVIGYAESKAAVECFTQNLAMEVAHRGISVNCIAPGLVRTPMSQHLEGSESQLNSPLGRWIEADEVATVVDFILAMGPALNGQILTVDGGNTVARTQMRLKTE